MIAAVNGWAMGAGCQLALLADIRISSENARYEMPEIRNGIPAVFGLELLWNTIGMRPRRRPSRAHWPATRRSR